LAKHWVFPTAIVSRALNKMGSGALSWCRRGFPVSEVFRAFKGGDALESAVALFRQEFELKNKCEEDMP